MPGFSKKPDILPIACEGTRGICQGTNELLVLIRELIVAWRLL